MDVWIYKARMLDMLGMVTRMQEGQTRIKQLMQGMSYNCNRKGHYARECPNPRVRDAKYFKEQMLPVAKDEAGVNLDEEENDFILTNAYGDDQLEGLNASMIMMAHI
uniref:CCHC-type domain-containing protein n=1 Tax=Tanacetum cinerariifolium TaxID=118510 RepID=A0A699H4B0_TANCI|nr:hypothetical protein [Tanacetum cinerariifolium]